jgi:hypothetical protein
MALRGVIHPEIVADLTHDDFPGVEADAHREADGPFEPQLVRVKAKLLLKMECRVTGPSRMILVGDRRAEQRHDSVAGELIDGALEPMDAFAEDREEAIHDPVPFLGINLLELHRALHVSEDDRHLLALALEGAAGSQDLLGEVFRGVGEWVQWWPSFHGLSDALSAVPAELFSRLVLRFAGCADEREASAAVGAEPPACSILPAAL